MNEETYFPLADKDTKEQTLKGLTEPKSSLRSSKEHPLVCCFNPTAPLLLLSEGLCAPSHGGCVQPTCVTSIFKKHQCAAE